MNQILSHKIDQIGGMLLRRSYQRPGLGVVQDRLDELGVEIMA